MILCRKKNKIKIKKSLESPHPPLNKRLQSLKLSATNVVNRDTCRLTVVRVAGSPHRVPVVHDTSNDRTI